MTWRRFVAERLLIRTSGQMVFATVGSSSTAWAEPVRRAGPKSGRGSASTVGVLWPEHSTTGSSHMAHQGSDPSRVTYHRTDQGRNSERIRQLPGQTLAAGELRAAVSRTPPEWRPARVTALEQAPRKPDRLYYSAVPLTCAVGLDVGRSAARAGALSRQEVMTEVCVVIDEAPKVSSKVPRS